MPDRFPTPGHAIPVRSTLDFGPRSTTTGGALLYFAYTALIDPDRMAVVSRNAAFDFVAHLPEWGLTFTITGNGNAPSGPPSRERAEWSGALPSAGPMEGSTVWGVVYAIPASDRSAVDAAEAAEGRQPLEVEVIDRTGKRHAVIAYVAESTHAPGADPSEDYLSIMVDGSRHWDLPAGWIVGLEDYLGVEL